MSILASKVGHGYLRTVNSPPVLEIVFCHVLQVRPRDLCPTGPQLSVGLRDQL